MQIQNFNFPQVIQILNFLNAIERQIQPDQVNEGVQVFNLRDDIITQLQFC